MLSRRSLIGSVMAATATAGVSLGSVGGPSDETLSMLNGRFWAAASPAERLFYVRAAHEAVTVYVDEEPKSAIGWTYEQKVSWIDSLYAQNSANLVLPVAVAYGFARRTSQGADAAQIGHEVKTLVQRLSR